jgi:hypothetical protein
MLAYYPIDIDISYLPIKHRRWDQKLIVDVLFLLSVLGMYKWDVY